MQQSQNVFRKSSPHSTQEIIGLLKMMVRLGHGYERLKPIAMGICENYAKEAGWDAAAFCPGTLDNFGPHVRL
jgi:hypothetical protein